jgi:hypothetical protein
VLGSLLRYAYGVRVGIAALMVAASLGQLGTHYDISGFVSYVDPFTGRARLVEPGSLRQVVDIAILPQLFFWPFYTMLTGLTGAVVVLTAAAIVRRQAKPADHFHGTAA